MPANLIDTPDNVENLKKRRLSAIPEGHESSNSSLHQRSHQLSQTSSLCGEFNPAHRQRVGQAAHTVPTPFHRFPNNSRFQINEIPVSDTSPQGQPQAEDSKDSNFKRCQRYIILVLIFGAVVLLFFVQLSTPIIPKLSLVDFSVPDGNGKGTIRLGTYGYCLYLPNKACSNANFLYRDKSDNPLLARVHSKTKLLSIVNISALLSASVGCFLSAFFSEWKLSAIALALLAVVFAAIGFGIEIFVMFRATADSQAGIGFWMTLVAILLLLVYIVVISIVFRRRRRTTW